MAQRAASRKPASQDPVPPLNESIYAVLRAHIEEGRFPSGLVIGEVAVARAFRASRAPANVALRRLREEGLLSAHDGRGFVVGDGEPVRISLEDAGLVLPEPGEGGAARNRRTRIYPEVEHAVAACLVYGRFLLNESALAEHYGVSRTVAHEVLTRLERSGLISQDTNQRWYAGPLTTDGIRHHFEMRRILEPAALKQAFPHLTPAELKRRRGRLDLFESGTVQPTLVESLESDLHFDTLAPCPNPLVLDTVRRSQLPLLATHSSFHHRQDPQEIVTMVKEHRAVFSALLANDVDKAAVALERHLMRSVVPTTELQRHLADLPAELARPYLVRVD